MKSYAIDLPAGEYAELIVRLTTKKDRIPWKGRDLACDLGDIGGREVHDSLWPCMKEEDSNRLGLVKSSIGIVGA